MSLVVVVLRIRCLDRRRTHTGARCIMYRLRCRITSLLRILITIHRERMWRRGLADRRLRLRGPCVWLAVCDSKGRTALLLHWLRVVLRWRSRTSGRCRLRLGVVCSGWCGGRSLGLLLAADAEPCEKGDKGETNEWTNDGTSYPGFA